MRGKEPVRGVLQGCFQAAAAEQRQLGALVEARALLI